MASRVLLALAAAALLLAAAPPAAAGRALRQSSSPTYREDPSSYGARAGNWGAYGSRSEAVITSGYAGTSSVGAIEGDGVSRGSQAANYVTGLQGAGAQTQLGAMVASETGGAGGANAAADLIRRQAGYQGSSIAGDMFVGDTRGASPAEDAIRRSQAENAMIQQRIDASAERTRSANPFNI